MNWKFSIFCLSGLLALGSCSKPSPPKARSIGKSQGEEKAVDLSSTPASPAAVEKGPSEPSLTHTESERGEKTPSSKSTDSSTLLRDYFDYLTTGKVESAHQLALRTLEDCEYFMASDHCATMLEGQLKLQEALQTDPVPRNSVLVEVQGGQKQSVTGREVFREGTVLWLGTLIRARGPGGNEFLMRSLGVLEREGKMKIIWGKRRAFGDTPRSLGNSGKANVNSELKGPEAK